MKRVTLPTALLLVSPFAVLAQDVGQGAPSGLEQLFVNAFYRNRFNSLVSLPPQGPVRRLGAGYVQEFSDAARKLENRFALVRADIGGDVYQIYPAINDYYTSVGVTNAGFPTMDTSGCASATTGTACSYQLFSKSYALFAYSSSLLTAGGSGFTVKDAFFTQWSSRGGITAYGPATSAETAITSTTAITATSQVFFNGALYSISSGAHTGKTYGVTGKIYTLYNSLGMHTGSLGLPLSEELTAGGGRIRQAFEGGSVEYTATTDPIVRPSVGGVNLDISVNQVLRLNLGDTVTVRANIVATTGESLTDREITWVTSNGRVVSVQSSGGSAVLRAVGGGAVQITAVSEGKISPALSVFVAAPCCQVGEGAPTTAIQQSFQDVVTRNRLNIQLPVAAPVTRSGTGYIQELRSADGLTRYLLCRSDLSPGVFVVTGDMLLGYFEAGGPAGALGYPIGDETATGRQMFEGGALAGRPIYTVSGPILTRWQALSFEIGALGNPVSAATTITSFTGASGTGQTFSNGFLIRIITGRFAATRANLVSGSFLAAYLSRGAADGNLGFPLNEPYATPQGFNAQDFEGGQIRVRGEEVEIDERERSPEVSVTPTRVTAGSRVRIIVGGFAAGATLRISFPSDATVPAFEIPTQQGSYSWEAPIATTARSGVVSILAQDANGQQRATGSYSVVALNEAPVQLTKLRGDTQTGVPGARLVQPLTIAAVDDQGSPLVGIAIRFAASPGSEVSPIDAVTNERGEASTQVRLQPTEGVVLVTAQGAGRVVTFSARSAASSLTNFPRQSQTGSFLLGNSSASSSTKGAMLAAVSSILRFHQNRNELSSSLGLSEPALLNSFLRDLCVLDTLGGRICDGYLTPTGPAEPIVNLWRLRDFVGGALDPQPLGAEAPALLDVLATGAPVLVVLRLTAGGAAAGTHFVAATGVAGDGSILIHDPNPATNRTRLDDYLAGFPLAGQQITATILDLIRLTPRSPSPSGFLVTADAAKISVSGQTAECGREFAWPGIAVLSSSGVTPGPAATSNIYYCSGLESSDIIQFTSQAGFQATLTDLATPGRRNELSGNGDPAWLATRATGQWLTSPVQLRVDPAVVNAATFSAELAPGSLATIPGVGFGSDAVVEIAGLRAVVPGATPFRLNVEIPPDTPPGEHLLRVTTSAGTADIAVQIQEAAPAIFRDASSPMVVNTAGGQRNTTSNPVARGASIGIYATGLGAVRQQGNAQVTVQPVTVVLQGQELQAQSAVRVANLPGVYLVTVTVPARVAPGLDVPLRLQQAGQLSNAVPVSIR